MEFFVEPDSTLSNFRIRKSPGQEPDEEAIRLLKEGPDWQPATSGNRAIRHEVKVRVPFKPRRSRAVPVGRVLMLLLGSPAKRFIINSSHGAKDTLQVIVLMLQKLC